MSRSSPWRQKARLTIDQAVDLARRDGITDPEELVRLANLAYPFGPKINPPYQVWRDELRQLRERCREDES